MREILFRGKKLDGKWVTGSYVRADHHWHNRGAHKDWIIIGARANGGWFAIQGRCPVIAETVGQYTGLQDENGKRIFEGDVVSHYKTTYIVGMDEDRGGWYPFACGDGCGCCEVETVQAYNTKIIGNIHDNPELIERAKDGN